MDASEIKDTDVPLLYVLKCIDNAHAKRELTLGKEYYGIYFQEDNLMFIKTDYGGQCAMSLLRFDLVNTIEPRN